MNSQNTYSFFFLFGVLRRFQHCTGHITTGSWKGRGNQYIQFVRVLYCKLPTNGKQLPAFPLQAVTGIEPRPQRWEARVLPLYHRGPQIFIQCPDVCVQICMCSSVGRNPLKINLHVLFYFIIFLGILYNSCETCHIESSVLLSLIASCLQKRSTNNDHKILKN